MNDLKFSVGGVLDYECIDPILGEELWRLADPATSQAERDQLDIHVTHCAACRIQLAVEQKVAHGLSDGTMSLPMPRVYNPIWWQSAAAVGGLALAACLALVFLVAPTPTVDGLVVRGASPEAGIESPVADEVLLGQQPTLRWSGLEKATSYRVSIQAVDGDYAWTGETESTEVRLPKTAPLPPRSRFRVFVEPVPAYLARNGGMRTSFSTGSLTEFMRYRFEAAGRGVLLLGLAGLLVLLSAGFLRRRLTARPAGSLPI